MKVRLMLLILIAVAAVPAVAAARRSVSVLYAGSLVTPMQGPIKTALAADGIDFQGEPGGSKELAHFIAAGLSNPDIFISVDPSLVTGLDVKVERAVTFAGTSLGIGWSENSKYAPLFARVANGRVSILAALATPNLRIARTDPRIDPKGAFTIEAMKLLAGTNGEARLLGADENPAQTFPEENLLVRIETGAADIGFLYRTEAIARHLKFVALPGAAAMRDRITYTVARMRNAPHPVQADAFMKYLLTQGGKAILERAGVEYLRQPRTLVMEK